MFVGTGHSKITNLNFPKYVQNSWHLSPCLKNQSHLVTGPVETDTIVEIKKAFKQKIKEQNLEELPNLSCHLKT